MRRFRRIGLSILSIALIVLTINLPARLNGAFPAGKQILLVEDPACETWASSSLAKLGITAYTTVSPAQFATVNLNLFDVLYVGNLDLDIAACRNLLTALTARSADVSTWAQSTLV